jgi:hypothetical protein
VGAWSGSVWFGEVGGGAAVLYSVVVGAVREFWVKTKKFNVKVHEIPLMVPVEQPVVDPQASGLNIVHIWKGYRSASWDPQAGAVKVIRTQVSENNITYEGVGTGAFNAHGDEIAAVWSSGVNFSGPPPAPIFRQASGRFYRFVWGYPKQPFSLWIVSGYFERIPVVGFENRFASPKPSFVGTRSSPAGSPSPPIDDFPEGYEVDNNYEAYISPSPTTLFCIIKYTKLYYDATYQFFKYFSISLANGSVQEVSPSPLDWRFPIASASPSAVGQTTICQRAYLFSDSSYLGISEDTLWGMDLSQSIGEESLRTLLESISNTITATLSTRTATSGASCTLGTAAESTVQVPSPGRGTVEGITYLP